MQKSPLRPRAEAPQTLWQMCNSVTLSNKLSKSTTKCIMFVKYETRQTVKCTYFHGSKFSFVSASKFGILELNDYMEAICATSFKNPYTHCTNNLWSSTVFINQQKTSEMCYSCEPWINKNKMVCQQIVDLWSMPSFHQYRQPAYQHVSLCGFIMSKSIKTWFWFVFIMYICTIKSSTIKLRL